jgi:hypothetical protein
MKLAIYMCVCVCVCAGLHALKELPSSLGSLPALTHLVIYGADGLERVPSTLGNLGDTLKVLQIAHCHK